MGDTKYRANSIIDKRNIINSNRNTYRQISFRRRSCTAQDPSPRMQRGSAKFFAHNRVTGHPSKSKSFLDPKRRNHYDRHRSILFPLLSLESIFLFYPKIENGWTLYRVKRRRSQPYYLSTASRCFPSLGSFPSSIVHPLFLLFNARVSISTLFLFITSVDTHFYLMKLSSTDEKLSFTRTRLLFAGGLGAGCTATPNVVRVSSDRMSDRRARDAGLDQRLASPGERTANLHPLLTIRF